MFAHQRAGQVGHGVRCFPIGGGFAADMPRAHGYSPKGRRCPGLVDWHKKGRTNAIGALVGQRLINVYLTKGGFPSHGVIIVDKIRNNQHARVDVR